MPPISKRITAGGRANATRSDTAMLEPFEKREAPAVNCFAVLGGISDQSERSLFGHSAHACFRPRQVQTLLSALNTDALLHTVSLSLSLLSQPHIREVPIRRVSIISSSASTSALNQSAVMLTSPSLRLSCHPLCAAQLHPKTTRALTTEKGQGRRRRVNLAPAPFQW